MPYITRNRRDTLDEPLRKLDHTLELLEDNPGDFNYVISCLLWRMFKRTRRYGTINTIMGILSCVGQEFYIRFARGYEDEAMRKNGDVGEFWWREKKPVSENPLGMTDEEIIAAAQSVGYKFKEKLDDEDTGNYGC